MMITSFMVLNDNKLNFVIIERRVLHPLSACALLFCDITAGIYTVYILLIPILFYWLCMIISYRCFFLYLTRYNNNLHLLVSQTDFMQIMPCSHVHACTTCHSDQYRTWEQKWIVFNNSKTGVRVNRRTRLI